MAKTKIHVEFLVDCVFLFLLGSDFTDGTREPKFLGEVRRVVEVNLHGASQTSIRVKLVVCRIA